MPGRNLVVITGSSGVGKSTVARGHLAPHLSLDSTQASVEDIAARIATAVREELGS